MVCRRQSGLSTGFFEEKILQLPSAVLVCRWQSGLSTGFFEEKILQLPSAVLWPLSWSAEAL